MPTSTTETPHVQAPTDRMSLSESTARAGVDAHGAMNWPVTSNCFEA